MEDFVTHCYICLLYTSNTFTKLTKAYGDEALSRAQVSRWFKQFSDGRESIKGDPRSGRPSKTDDNVDRIRDLYTVSYTHLDVYKRQRLHI